MAIDVTCDNCFSIFSVADKNAGKRGKCPDCGSPVVVPLSSGGSLSRSGQMRSGSQRKSASKRKATESSSAAPVGLIIGGVAVVLLVGVGAFFLGRAGGSSAEPAVVAANDVENDSSKSELSQPDQAADSNGSDNPDPSDVPPVDASSVVPVSQTSTIQQPTDALNPAQVVQTAATVDFAGPVADTGTETDVELSLPDLIEMVEPSVVRINVKTDEGGSQGSGFVVDTEGTVVTNYHVIEGASEANAVFQDGTRVPVLGFHVVYAKKDIAIVKIEIDPEKLKPLPLAREMPRKGEKMVAFGAPLGFDFTATEGTVSATRTGEFMTKQGAAVEGDWVQHTTPISPGNSGGPLVNMAGEVVAMNTMTLQIGQNLNFGISAIDIYDALQNKGTEVTQFEPSKLPKVSKAARTEVVEEIGTPLGNEVLAEIDEVAVAYGSVNQAQDLTRERGFFFVMEQAEKYLEQAGLDYRRVGMDDVRSADAFAIILINFLPTGTPGNVRLEVGMQVLAKHTDDDGKTRIIKIWDEKEQMGGIALLPFLQGKVPRLCQNNIRDFFKGFYSARRRAEKAVEDAKEQENGKSP